MSPKSKARSPKLPFVLVNMAMTADGKIATANRAVHSFSSERDLEHLYELRATADAVMCGARTVEISRTILGTGGEQFRKRRLKRGLAEYQFARRRQRQRLDQSARGHLPKAFFARHHFDNRPRFKSETPAICGTLADEVKVCGKREINFGAALRWLRTKWGVTAAAVRRRRRTERRPVPRRSGGRAAFDHLPEDFRRRSGAHHRRRRRF